MNLIVRKIHKYLSFFISVQLLLWTVSGIYFAFNKIELVRGEQYLKQVEQSIDLGQFNFTISNSSKIDIKKRLNENIIVTQINSKAQYLNKSGKPLKKLSKNEAMASVINQTTLSPYSVEEVVDLKAGAEFRGRPLPIYRVKTKNDQGVDINAYLNIYSGEVIAIRSNKWRIWDLMWGVHIMDWRERDNIDNLLLKIFSILALVSSVTGVMLFFKLDFKNSNKK